LISITSRSYFVALLGASNNLRIDFSELLKPWEKFMTKRVMFFSIESYVALMRLY